VRVYKLGGFVPNRHCLGLKVTSTGTQFQFHNRRGLKKTRGDSREVH
jgi:hypothetical protein